VNSAFEAPGCAVSYATDGPCSVAIVTILQLVPSNDFVLVRYQSHSGRQTTPIATAPPPDHVRVELG
jgi:hypothetical protein